MHVAQAAQLTWCPPQCHALTCLWRRWLCEHVKHTWQDEHVTCSWAHAGHTAREAYRPGGGMGVPAGDAAAVHAVGHVWGSVAHWWHSARGGPRARDMPGTSPRAQRSCSGPSTHARHVAGTPAAMHVRHVSQRTAGTVHAVPEASCPSMGTV